jgi:hypothetical protein
MDDDGLEKITRENESKWQQVLNKERLAKEKEEKNFVANFESSKKDKKKENQIIDGESSDKDQKSEGELADRMDYLAAQENLGKFMEKLDTHLETEKVLINDWDKQRRKKYAKAK